MLTLTMLTSVTLTAETFDSLTSMKSNRSLQIKIDILKGYWIWSPTENKKL